jgi:dienelactone hydrolase
VGVSLGAPFAVIGAAEQDYRGVVIIDGFGDLPHTLRHQFARRWRTRYGVLGDVLAWVAEAAVIRLIDLPDPEYSARRLRPNQRVYVINAEDDEFVPERSQQALRDALRQSSAQLTVETTPGRHVRALDEQVISRLYAQARDWMRRQALVD